MRDRLWFGRVRNAEGKGTILVFDRRRPRIDGPWVTLFNLKKRALVTYNREALKSLITPVDPNSNKERITYVAEEAYFRYLHDNGIETDLKYKGGWIWGLEDPDGWQDPEPAEDRRDQVAFYEAHYDNDREDGWFYSDTE